MKQLEGIHNGPHLKQAPQNVLPFFAPIFTNLTRARYDVKAAYFRRLELRVDFQYFINYTKIVLPAFSGFLTKDIPL